ncbi:MAG: PQQ-dependent sugar dehydrogenase [Boseongicola sp.]
MLRSLVALAAFLWPVTASAVELSVGDVEINPVVSGLEQPWSVGFLPDGAFLITERDGRLLYVQNGTRHEISGVPEVADIGQGGLLDVLVPSDFEHKREIFLSYAKHQSNGAGTALLRGRLSDDKTKLSNIKTVFEMSQGSSGGRHFGSRIVEADDGSLFISIGDRADRPAAQDLSRHNGSIIRLNRDGSAHADNPFVGQSGARPEIWSYGHRNPQGMALDASGQLWAVEHGAQGGDEVNQIRRGANFGWPVIAYGRHYSGGRIGEGTSKPGMEQPEYFWDPSMAPSGLMIYSGKLWPEWRGHVFVGSLKFDYISRLTGRPLREAEQISSEETERVRDVREGPDGAIWFLSVGNGTLYRIRPSN